MEVEDVDGLGGNVPSYMCLQRFLGSKGIGSGLGISISSISVNVVVLFFVAAFPVPADVEVVSFSATWLASRCSLSIRSSRCDNALNSCLVFNPNLSISTELFGGCFLDSDC